MFDWFNKRESLLKLRRRMDDLELDMKTLKRHVDDLALDISQAKKKKIFSNQPEKQAETKPDPYKGALAYDDY